jgi:peroxiredoxin
MQLVELQTHYDQFIARQVEIIALSRDNLQDIKTMREETQAEFPILSDQDAAIMKLYGVYNLLGDGVAAPSIFILDHEGNIRTSYIGQHAGDRPTAKSILQVIDLIASEDAISDQ